MISLTVPRNLTCYAMRHKYETPCIVLARTPLGEANALLTLLTREVGLLRARAQGLRKPGAKLAPALTTLAESDVVLVRGIEGWRISGAVLTAPRFKEIGALSRIRAARVAELLVRLVPGEEADPRLFHIFAGFLATLVDQEEPEHDAAECLAVLQILSVLGLDSGELPHGAYSPTTLQEVREQRPSLIMRINRGIAASGL